VGVKDNGVLESGRDVVDSRKGWAGGLEVEIEIVVATRTTRSRSIDSRGNLD